MKRFVLVILALLLAAGTLGAETYFDKLTLSADCAAFRNPSGGGPYIEFYFGLYRHELGFIGTDTSEARYAGVYLTAYVYTDSGIAVDSVSTYFVTRAASKEIEEMKGIQLYDLLVLPVPPGDYQVKFTAIDNVSKAMGTLVKEINVPDFDDGSFVLSGIEMACKIQRIDPDAEHGINPRLFKEDRLVIPNPLGMYAQWKDNYMYVYSELYGLNVGDATDSFAVQYSIKDSLGNSIKVYDRAVYGIPGEAAVISEQLDIRDVPAGTHLLMCMVEEVGGLAKALTLKPSAKALSLKPFAIVGKTLPAELTEEADAQLMVNIAYYHLSEAEKIQASKLNIEGKRNFIKQFWRSRDEDPSDPENQFYNTSVQRYVYANEHFSTRFEEHDGWQTDRGRIYILYGPYNEVASADIDGRRYPYEKWTYYDLDGTRIFVFANDYSAGVGNYRLVHSTHPREVYSPEWQQILEGDVSPEDDWRDARDDEVRDPMKKDK